MSVDQDHFFQAREDAHGADKLFVERWSHSCFNDQPWRFYTSTPDTHDDYVSLLLEGNRVWASTAPVIGFLCSRKQFSSSGESNAYNAFDAGAAWMAMTLQARMSGLYTHGMGGIDKAAVAEYLGIDTAAEEVLMGFVIGHRGSVDDLPEKVREGEQPTPRESLEHIWTQGKP